MADQVKELQQLLEQQLPERSDALVWLQGDRYDRGPTVLELYRRGFAPVIILTGNNVLIGKGTRAEEDNISLAQMRSWLAGQAVAPERIEIDDGAMNTHEQAEQVIGLARARQWKKIIIVGSIHYQLRAFLTFLKSAQAQGWPGRLINQMVKLDWNAVPSGRIKTARVYFDEELEKVRRYQNHLAPIEAGIAYLNQ